MNSIKISFRSFQLCIILSICSLTCSLHASTENGQVPHFQLTQDGHLFQFDTDGIRLKNTQLELHTRFVNADKSSPLIQHSGSPAKPCSMFSRVDYQQLWPGIDLSYDTVENGIIRSTWDIAVGAKVKDIRLHYNADLNIDPAGRLRIRNEQGEIHESAPIAWQVIDGMVQPVDVAFQLHNANQVGFDTGPYNKNYPLKIDPTLQWNTFEGSGSTDFRLSYSESGAAITLDTTNNSYLAVNATFFLLGVGNSYSEQVIKLDPDGNKVWQTTANAAGLDHFSSVRGITLDSDGNIYVVGSSTDSLGTPINAHTGDDLDDVYVIKLNSEGTHVWKTYIGGSEFDFAGNITVDNNDNIYVIGSSDNTWGTPVSPHSGNGERDFFIQKLNKNGSYLWHTFLGGDGSDSGADIRVDSAGNSYLVGTSNSTWGSPIRAYSALNDAFAAKLNSSGVLVWNTFMGGTNSDLSRGLDLDDDGNLHLIGTSTSSWGSLPVSAYTAGNDAFVVKIDTDGNKQWHTFIGSSDNDSGADIAVDANNYSYITGFTTSGWQDNRTGIPVMILNDEGNSVWYSAITGANEDDSARAIAVSGDGDFYISGESFQSWGTPVSAYAGNGDAFAAMFSSQPTQSEECDFYSFVSGNSNFIHVCL